MPVTPVHVCSTNFRLWPLSGHYKSSKARLNDGRPHSDTRYQAMTVESAQELTVTSQDGKLITLSFTDTILFIKQQGTRRPKSFALPNQFLLVETQAKIPIRQVIGAYYFETSLEVYLLSKEKRKSEFSLVKIEGKARDTNNAENWSNALMDAAYQGALLRLILLKPKLIMS
jgi:hypothetical protein